MSKFCKVCGGMNLDSAVNCSRCGNALNSNGNAFYQGQASYGSQNTGYQTNNFSTNNYQSQKEETFADKVKIEAQKGVDYAKNVTKIIEKNSGMKKIVMIGVAIVIVLIAFFAIRAAIKPSIVGTWKCIESNGSAIQSSKDDLVIFKKNGEVTIGGFDAQYKKEGNKVTISRDGISITFNCEVKRKTMTVSYADKSSESAIFERVDE